MNSSPLFFWLLWWDYACMCVCALGDFAFSHDLDAYLLITSKNNVNNSEKTPCMSQSINLGLRKNKVQMEYITFEEFERSVRLEEKFSLCIISLIRVSSSLFLSPSSAHSTLFFCCRCSCWWLICFLFLPAFFNLFSRLLQKWFRQTLQFSNSFMEPIRQDFSQSIFKSKFSNYVFWIRGMQSIWIVAY